MRLFTLARLEGHLSHPTRALGRGPAGSWPGFNSLCGLCWVEDRQREEFLGTHGNSHRGFSSGLSAGSIVGEQESSAVGGHRRRATTSWNSFGTPVSPCHRQSWASSTRDTGLGEAWRDLGSCIHGLGEKGPPASLVMAKCDRQNAAVCGYHFVKSSVCPGV